MVPMHGRKSKDLSMTQWLSMAAGANWLNFAIRSLGCFWLSYALCSAAAQPEARVDFARDIRPIFNKHCVACHGGVKRAGGVSFIVRSRALAQAKSGEVPIRPGDPSHSELIRLVTSKDDTERMPPPVHGPPLSQTEMALLRDWIQQGAEWKEHWAYVKPRTQPIPVVSNPERCW